MKYVNNTKSIHELTDNRLEHTLAFYTKTKVDAKYRCPEILGGAIHQERLYC